MKRVLSVSVLSLMLAGGGVVPSHASEPGELVSKLFLNVCLKYLPNYEGADLALEAAGYQFDTYGDNEFEFSFGTSGVWGAFQIGEDSAGCSVLHESLSEIDTQQIGLNLAKQFSDVEPEIWNYQGVPSAWVVPYKNKFLYIIYNEGGLSSDIRDE